MFRRVQWLVLAAAAAACFVQAPAATAMVSESDYDEITATAKAFIRFNAKVSPAACNYLTPELKQQLVDNVNKQIGSDVYSTCEDVYAGIRDEIITKDGKLPPVGRLSYKFAYVRVDGLNASADVTVIEKYHGMTGKTRVKVLLRQDAEGAPWLIYNLHFGKTHVKR